MAKTRRKKRTHVPNNDVPGKPGQANRRPKSMVIRMGAGDVGPSVTQLARDFRTVMEPDTASRLKERKANKLKDYTAMAGPLGVTHLFLFSRSKTGNVHLRVALAPRGPTLTFRVERYALCKDIAKAQKHPRGGGKEYLHAPLLVMNNFTSQAAGEPNADPIKKQLESLTTTVFQGIFPPISPQTTPLNSIKRVLLLNRESQAEGTYVISLRHYAITTRKAGVSKRVRRFDPSEQRLREKKTGALPNLGKLDDVADYILDPAAGGYTSASETELDTDAEVEVTQTTTQRVLSRREQQKQQAGENDKGKAKTAGPASNVERRAVKLVELGPRMRLRMVKVEEGICEGRVMWNEFVTKTKAEEKELDEKWAQKRKEKEARKQQQRENIERKKQLKKNTKANAGQGEGEEEDDEEEEWDSDELEDWDDDDLNDDDDSGDEDEEDQDHDQEMEG
ncbi:rRNA-binding ribosome biosynthesis protein [Exophiala dermatitidis]|uniref:Purinergic receptor P2Y, G protein-coupled, 11 n=2 Tax=Exophiala dermatitidis TaxID=5970 RepID=H6BPR7_EXODN|nr:purinergic receptor P2Y, G protein-coupled, 11 [Exophiala dermatitidis NIH/UT8656]KAJ4518830.1 rRNA-binding ribosome biosynthesis protein [Exophiala dermatitidis]EHY53669.1 purinergic receptor P2Y, G protein-coupled, 11 [Exophiala dermatitidis NIH/UT8656]KAJ4522154.1 rRNA-binding ribosome biosynthesis protein [Exophiala dermatitidis]KAJ4529480.1 rRNA-binding ribosome biosynthesis protein [Exophiala dermatitidis]KAJ4543863.1 rRNA-binding ribosome biosynthesis protein [Exophiala dermatitidis]